MIISDLEFFLIELPADVGPVRNGRLRSVLVRVACDTGKEGWGETCKSWRAGELAARRKMLLTVLAGREAFDIESILGLEALADRELACGIEMALWDLLARHARLPLCQLLGGSYRRRVPLSARLPTGTNDAIAAAARGLAAQGITSQIVNSTGEPDDDLLLLHGVRQMCPDRVQLRLDARRQYDLARAARLCEELEPGSVQYVLDPLISGELDALAVLNAQVRVPLAAGEAIRRPADVAHVARVEAASFVLVDPARVGGLTRARQCANVAEACGLAPILRWENTSGLAVAAGLQLAAATPSFVSGYETSYPVLHDDILREPLAIADGMLAVPAANGMGVEIDREKLDRYALGG